MQCSPLLHGNWEWDAKCDDGMTRFVTGLDMVSIGYGTT